LEEGCLFTAHSLDIAIEIVDDLSGYALDLFDLVDLSFLKERLVLTEDGFDGCFEYVRLCFRLLLDLRLLNYNLLLFLFLL
jgi:hypothetical protein